ncbi:MAG: hypothetical protein DHS20C16_14840 [Phycisphaerae bacterium]|nr:MAG: hypothetical protein DHS20C16_14840 [Phycisphaerae bacterium]
MTLLYYELERVPTGILIAWIPVICEHTNEAAGEAPKRDALPTGCRLVGGNERLENRTPNDK